MLETQAGRLKWERTADGIRVVIPVKVGWIAAMSGFSLWTLPWFAWRVVMHFIHVSDRTSHIVWAITVCCGVCFVIFWLTMILTISQVLTLNPAEMTLQTRLFGIGGRKRMIANSRFSNLRYAASEYGASMNEMSRIEIDRDSITRKFAFGITELEADTLIEKMMEIYKFPEGHAR